MHPSGASGDSVEVVLGPVRFQVQAPEANLRFTQGGLRIEAECSTDGPYADSGLHFGPLAMLRCQPARAAGGG
eukprot:14901987-Alexandrium_andersonii.AAC.1